MKKLHILLISLINTAGLFAQAPQSFTYQAAVRDSEGAVIANTRVGMQISILKDSTTGASVCVEEFTPQTNDFGLVSLQIGSENKSDFSAIDWSAYTYFVKVELDPTGGTAYTEMGTSQLLSVPYALHAKTADSVHITGNEPAFDGWDKNADSWSQMGSTIYYTGGNVGIGNSRPSAKLDVIGNTKLGTYGVTFSELREITGTTHSTSAFVSRTLPGGYDQENTRVLSLSINYGGTRWTGLGHDNGGGSNTSTAYLIFGSTLYIYYPDLDQFKDRSYRVLLMKVE